MLVPAWLVAYAVVFLVGVIVGLLARFLLALVAVVVVMGLFGVAVLGLLDRSLLSYLLGFVRTLSGGLPFSLATFFTFGALIFAGGVLAGVLLTTPLRAFQHSRPTA